VKRHCTDSNLFLILLADPPVGHNWELLVFFFISNLCKIFETTSDFNDVSHPAYHTVFQPRGIDCERCFLHNHKLKVERWINEECVWQKKKKKRYKHSYKYRDYLGWPEVVTQWLGLFSFITDIRVFKTTLTYVENITGIQNRWNFDGKQWKPSC